MVASAVLALLLVASVFDLRARRIPNRLIAVMLVSGVLVSTAIDPVIPGLARALAGVAIGTMLWLPGWFLRMMGAGDVKLFGAVGAWLGPVSTLNAAIITALAGGLLALIWMFVQRGAHAGRRTLWVAVLEPRTLLNSRFDSKDTRNSVPYSLAITAGVAVELVFPGLLFR